MAQQIPDQALIPPQLPCGAPTMRMCCLRNPALPAEDASFGLRLARAVRSAGEADFLGAPVDETISAPTVQAASLMLDAIRAATARGVTAGFDVSGGIGTIDQALAYLMLYEHGFRLGSATALSLRVGSSTLIKPIMAVLH